MTASQSRPQAAGFLAYGIPDGSVSRDAALETLYHRYYVDLLRMAYCLVGERGRAEDAVQDAFVSIYDHWDGLRDRSAALPYLRAAVVNRCRTRLRERLRELTTGEITADVVATDDPERDTLDQETADRLARAVRGLPTRQREAIVCRYYLELDIAQTAELLGITVGSVKRHTHRGLGTLGIRVGDDR